MNPHRISLWLSIFGGLILTSAATALVTVSPGMVGEVRVIDPDGTAIVTAERRTASIVQDSPGVALGWIAAALGIAVIATLLTRFGGIVGAGLVFMVMGLVVLASMVTRIGIYIMPGATFLGASALVALVDRVVGPRATTSVPTPPGD